MASGLQGWVRTTIEVVIVAVTLPLLLWGADGVARSGAESMIARNVQMAAGTPDLPRVSVHGRWFIPQVLTGVYERVEVRTETITAGPLRVARVDSDLTDVRLPFHDFLVRDLRVVGVGHSDEVAFLRYSDLNDYFAAIGRPMTLRLGEADTVRLSGDVDLLGQRIAFRSDVDLSVSQGNLVLVPRTLDTDGQLSAATRVLLSQRLRVTVPMDSLPFGHRLTGVTASADGLLVGATGDAIIVRP